MEDDEAFPEEIVGYHHSRGSTPNGTDRITLEGWAIVVSDRSRSTVTPEQLCGWTLPGEGGGGVNRQDERSLICSARKDRRERGRTERSGTARSKRAREDREGV